jgi:hypothetical protein
VPSKAFLEVIANKQPGVKLPEINKGITQAVSGKVADVATSGMSNPIALGTARTSIQRKVVHPSAGAWPGLPGALP